MSMVSAKASSGVAAVALFASSTIASAENCPVQLAAPSQTNTIAALVAKAKTVASEKDEFETTAAYQARLAKGAEILPQEAFTVAIPAPGAGTYDADKQTVSVSRYALSGTCLVYSSSLSDAARATSFGKPPPSYGGTALGSDYCATREVSHVDGRPYTASNAYGASITVTPVTSQQVGVYFGQGAPGQALLQGDKVYGSNDPMFSFAAAPEEARALKSNGQFLLLIKLRAPYVTSGRYHVEPKIDSPSDITFKSSMLVAELLCVGYADKATGKVFASRAASHD